MHEKRFDRAIEKLRDPDRVARMEVKKVVSLSLEGSGEMKSVLDIGTGSGLFAEAFDKKRLFVTGIDANPEMLPVATHFVPTGLFKEGTAEAIPFGDREFDLVFMGLVLHETDDMKLAFSEAYRVSKKRLVVLEWPYLKQEFGPGFNERIPSETIKELATQVGFKEAVEHRLKYLVLYCFDR
jgi:ubiquinone/menaquinone biosynthesis C-methylase UbiE